MSRVLHFFDERTARAFDATVTRTSPHTLISIEERKLLDGVPHEGAQWRVEEAK
jgi:hypothetical protein